MNIILFTRRRGWQLQLDLRRPPTALAAACMLVLVVGAVFSAGFAVAMRHTDPVASRVGENLETQREELTALKRTMHEQLDALAVRVGEVQGHVIRLNVLGERLTQMADLDDGEFNFAEAPAVGGPESPPAGASPSIAQLVQDLEQLSLQLDDREAQLDVLESLLLTRDLQAQVYPDGRPVDSGWISSYFGSRTDPFNGRPAMHEGIDFAGREGSTIKAIAAGVVSFADLRHGYGNCIEINHGNGYVTRYAHNRANLVSVGDKIEKGQAIALMGATGHATGPHLHFEVLHYGKVVNPLKYINRKTG
jgi:murein DD-endopeptidase MepM/ murein hydrolase activator NlpD